MKQDSGSTRVAKCHKLHGEGGSDVIVSYAIAGELRDK